MSILFRFAVYAVVYLWVQQYLFGSIFKGNSHFCLLTFIFLTLPIQNHVFQKIAWFGIRGSCWYPQDGIFFPSASPHGSGPRLRPFSGYIVQMKCTRSGPQRLHRDIPYVLHSASMQDWGCGTRLQKVIEFNPRLFVHRIFLPLLAGININYRS